MYPILSIPGAVHGVVFVAFLVVLYSVVTLLLASAERISHARHHIKYVYILGFAIGVIASLITAPAGGGWGIVAVIIYAPAYLGTLILGLIPIYFISQKRFVGPATTKPPLPWFYVFGADLRALAIALFVGAVMIITTGLVLAGLPRTTMPNLASIYSDFRSFRNSQGELSPYVESAALFDQQRPLTKEERTFLFLVGQSTTMTASEMMNPITSSRNATPWRKFVYDTKMCASQRILFVYPGCVYFSPENGFLVVEVPAQHLQENI